MNGCPFIALDLFLLLFAHSAKNIAFRHNYKTHSRIFKSLSQVSSCNQDFPRLQFSGKIGTIGRMKIVFLQILTQSASSGLGCRYQKHPVFLFLVTSQVFCQQGKIIIVRR